MFKKIFHFFDKLEDKVRARLSHIPIIYAIIGAILIVVFWRGVWATADILEKLGGVWFYIFYPPVTIVWSVGLLLLVGLFVSFFIGDRIIISGIKQEKRIDEQTEEEIKKEEEEIHIMRKQIKQISEDIIEIKNVISNKNK